MVVIHGIIPYISEQSLLDAVHTFQFVVLATLRPLHWHSHAHPFPTRLQLKHHLTEEHILFIFQCFQDHQSPTLSRRSSDHQIIREIQHTQNMANRIILPSDEKDFHPYPVRRLNLQSLRQRAIATVHVLCRCPLELEELFVQRSVPWKSSGFTSHPRLLLVLCTWSTRFNQSFRTYWVDFL